MKKPVGKTDGRRRRVERGERLLGKRAGLGFFPTPLHRLDRLSTLFPEYEILVKRDDQTGLALGGNKTRKLEYLLQESVDQGCDTLITAGAAQSNHCRQTAAAAARFGLGCHLVLKGHPPAMCGGNYLVDKLLGASIHWSEGEDRAAMMSRVAEDLVRQGRRPYVIPIGGSNKTGCLGYVQAVSELCDQLKTQRGKVDYIVFASSSGGTHAGLMVGCRFYGLEAKIIGISVDKTSCWDVPLEEHILDLANQTGRTLGLDGGFGRGDLALVRGYDSAGYGVVTSAEADAISLMARTEGIILDPVYTGRAFAGLLDMLEKRIIPAGSRILFWHTGGAPALFHYADEVLAKCSESGRL